MIKIIALAVALCFWQSLNYRLEKKPRHLIVEKKAAQPYNAYELSLLQKGFVDLSAYIPGIRVDLKYGTKDNFTGEVLYTFLSHAFLHKDAAEKLKVAHRLLKQHDSTLTFIVFDAFRPQQVQYKMWKIVKNTLKEKYVADPVKGSLHNYGCAVDLSIVKNDTVLLDMGTPFDHFGKLAEYRHNLRFLAEKKLTKEQVSNRVLLRTIMQKAGFQPINSEWWHFNAFENSYVRQYYQIIK